MTPKGRPLLDVTIEAVCEVGSPLILATLAVIAAILPLATAYNICEGLGFESGINKRFSEAKLFYSLYTLLIVLGAGLILIPRLPLLNVILFSQVANGILLPFVLIFMLKLVNRRKLMGDLTNNRLQNGIAWTTAVVMIALTVAWIGMQSPRNERGLAFGVRHTGNLVTLTVVPAAMGLLAGATGLAAIWLVMAGFLAAGAVVAGRTRFAA